MKNVLIVDDDESSRRRLSEQLHSSLPDFSVHTAPHGEEALNVLAGTIIDVVVVDTEMPVMDGLELLTAMLTRAPTTPVIVMTNSPPREGDRLSLTCPSLICLKKPVDGRVLGPSIDELMKRYASDPAMRLSIAAVVEIFAHERRTCTLRVTCPGPTRRAKPQTGHLDILRGAIVHADLAGHDGEPAAKYMLMCRTTSVEVLPIRDDRPISVKTPVHNLIASAVDRAKQLKATGFRKVGRPKAIPPPAPPKRPPPPKPPPPPRKPPPSVLPVVTTPSPNSDTGEPHSVRTVVRSTVANQRIDSVPPSAEIRERGSDRGLLAALFEAEQAKSGGEIVVRAANSSGRVFFVGSRVAWAVVSKKPVNLVGQLMSEARINRGDIEIALEECKSTGASLWDTLVDWELVSSDHMRRIVLGWIAACLGEMCSWQSGLTLFLPERQKYKGELLFTVAEVLEAAGVDPNAPPMAPPIAPPTARSEPEAPRIEVVEEFDPIEWPETGPSTPRSPMAGGPSRRSPSRVLSDSKGIEAWFVAEKDGEIKSAQMAEAATAGPAVAFLVTQAPGILKHLNLQGFRGARIGLEGGRTFSIVLKGNQIIGFIASEDGNLADVEEAIGRAL